MPSDISEVQSDGRDRWRFSFVDDDGQHRVRTGKARRELERERLRLLQSEERPAPIAAKPISAAQGSPAWWRALTEEAALAARAALLAQDPAAASLARKTAAAIADLCRSGGLASQLEEVAGELESLLEFVEKRLSALGFKSPDYERAAEGYRVMLAARRALAGEASDG